MATVTKGVTFISGDQVTASALATLVTNLGISMIVRGDVDSSKATLVHRSTGRPAGPFAREGWQDIDAQAALKVYVGGVWYPLIRMYRLVQPVGSSGMSQGDILSPVNVIGDVVRVRQANSTNYLWSTFAVAAEDADQDANSIAIVRGITQVNISGTASPGDLLQASSTSGSCEATTTPGLNVFGVALTSQSGGQVWAWLRR